LLSSPQRRKREIRGGEEFRRFYEQANVETRQNGKYPTTTNKLVSLFLPAYMGLPGWTDAYGNDIVEYPDEEQWAWMQRHGHDERIGSKDKLLRDRQQLLESGLDDLYAEETTYFDCILCGGFFHNFYSKLRYTTFAAPMTLTCIPFVKL